MKRTYYAQKSTFLPDALEINVSFRLALVKAFLDKTSAKTSTSFQLISSTARVTWFKSQQQDDWWQMYSTANLKTPAPTSTKIKMQTPSLILIYVVQNRSLSFNVEDSVSPTQRCSKYFFANRQDRIVTTTNLVIIYHSIINRFAPLSLQSGCWLWRY